MPPPRTRAEASTAQAAPARRGTAVVTLGLLTAIGGLVDVGNLVANPQAGAGYGLTLLPLVLVSGAVVALFSEMSGRVAAVTGVAGYEVVVRRLPSGLSRANLLASALLTVMTCAAEIGGISQLAGYLTGTSPRVWAMPVALSVAVAIVTSTFARATQVLGLAGLTMAVVVVALVAGHARWPGASALFVGPGGHPAAFAYVAVAQVGSMLVPYQLVFFSSGTSEERWGRGALGVIRSNAWIGYGAGTLFAAALVALAARLYLPGHHAVRSLAQVLTMPVHAGTGTAGETVMALAMLTALVGAAFETSLATGYMVAQYRRWSWGMDDSPSKSRPFFVVTVGTLVVAGSVMSAGVDVFRITDYSLVLSTVVLPFTYWPVWRAARDRSEMRVHASGRLGDAAGLLGLVLVTLVALAAVPALVLGS